MLPSGQPPHSNHFQMDKAPLSGDKLSKDSSLIINATSPDDMTRETMHHMEAGKLVIDDLSSLPAEVITFLDKRAENYPSTTWLNKIMELKSDLEKIDYIGQYLTFIQANLDCIKQISTRYQLIILADIMAAIFALSSLPNIAKRYEAFIPGGWQIFSLFAYLISYNYVRDDECTIIYPVYHKLIISNLARYLNEDIPTLIEMFTTISDIEHNQADIHYLPQSNLFTTSRLLLNTVHAVFHEQANFEDLLRKKGFQLKIDAIQSTCDVVDNYYNLVKLETMLQRATTHDLSASLTSKHALLDNLVAIGECIKHLSFAFRKQVKYINWQTYKDIRDLLEHPDEAGRHVVIHDLIDDAYASQDVTLAHIQKELIALSLEIQKLLTRFYLTPGSALLRDQQDRLFIANKHNFHLPTHLKANGKEKRKFYALKVNAKTADYWIQAFSGKHILADDDVAALNELSAQQQNFSATVQKLLDINKAVLQQVKLTRWADVYQIDLDDLKQFLDLITKFDLRDPWLQILDGKKICLEQSLIATTLQLFDQQTQTKKLLAETIIKKVTPKPTSGLWIIFNQKCAANLDNLAIIDMIRKHLALAQGILHDKLHDAEFMERQFSKFNKFEINNFKHGFDNLTSEEYEKLTMIIKPLPTPDKMTDTALHQASLLYQQSGIYDKLETQKRLTSTQWQEINDGYDEQYDAKIADILLNNPTICDALQYYCSVVFALVKKLLEQNLLDQAVVPMLEYLKKVRNYLAHQDDHVSKIVKASPTIHISVLGRELGRIDLYFEDLKNRLIDHSSTTTSAIHANVTPITAVHTHLDPPTNTEKMTAEQETCHQLQLLTSLEWKYSKKLNFYFAVADENKIEAAKQSLKGKINYSYNKRHPKRLKIESHKLNVNKLFELTRPKASTAKGKSFKH